MCNQELLAVVRFTRQYRHYLLGRKSLVRTDHNSLTWLLRFKYIEGQLARWLEELSQFDMTVFHRPGVKHGNADAMSRISDDMSFCDCYRAGSDPESFPCGGCRYCTRAHNQWSRFSEDVDDVVPLAVKTVNVIKPVSRSEPWITGYSKDELREIQSVDPCVGKLITWIANDMEPEQRELYPSSPDVKHFYICRKQLMYKDNLLYYRWEEEAGNRLLLMVPNQLKQEVMSLNHDLPLSGHMGIVKTLARIKQSLM